MTSNEPGMAAFAVLATTDKYLGMRGVADEDRATLGAIVERAQRDSTGDAAAGFLARLSEGELTALQKAHNLVEAINVAALSDDGAMKLLRQFDQPLDPDDDGFVATGAATAWQFPPVNAPADVRAAWTEATEGLADMQTMLKMAPFMAKAVGANIRFDADGDAVGMAHPSDADYRDIFAEPGFSYAQMTRGLLAELERFKYTLSAADYGERKAFLGKVLTALERRGWSPV